METSFFNPTTIRQFLPGFEQRNDQEAFARQVMDALSQKRTKVIEAGTGTGKTLGYLIPLIEFAAKNDVRVAISTETKSLQSQILDKDLPLARSITGKEVVAELCLGSGNFLCKRRLSKVVTEQNYGPEMMYKLDAFLDWEQSTATGIRSDFPDSLPYDFAARVFRDSEDCLSRKCPNFSRSHYFVARERWKQANLLVLNHSLLAAHLSLDEKLLPEFDYLVVDEAHRLPEVFRDSFQAVLSISEFQTLIKSVADSMLESLWKEFSDRLISEFPLFPGQQKRIHQPVNFPRQQEFMDLLDAQLEVLKAQIQELSDDEPGDVSSYDLNGKSTDEEHANWKSGSQEMGERLLVLSRRYNRLSSGQQVLEKILAGPTLETVHWVQRSSFDQKIDLHFHVAPVDIAPMIQSHLIDRMAGLVFTSATMATANNDFRYFLSEIGGEGATCLTFPSPFDFEKRTLLYHPKQMPDPAREEDLFHQQVCDEIQQLEKLTSGGAFVLFTSRKSLAYAERQLNGRMHIISQMKLGPVQALREFRASRNAVLFGLASFWQGVDIPGDSLRLVIIVRIPFRVPDEPLLEARFEMEKRRGGDPFRNIQLPHAAISIRQGFGRLMRSTVDRGIVALLDPRIYTKSYGKTLLQSLPVRKVYRDLVDIEHSYNELFDFSV